jgi:ribosome-binding factor A
MTVRQPSQRQLRVGEAIRHALADLLRPGALHDPALENASITVTEVRVSPDLRAATAFVMPLGGARIEETVAALNRAAPVLRGQAARAVRLKFAPSLRFEVDRSFEEADRIERLLRRDDVARDLAHGDEDDAGDGAEDGHGA